jgi:hypothetical protein
MVMVQVWVAGEPPDAAEPQQRHPHTLPERHRKVSATHCRCFVVSQRSFPGKGQDVMSSCLRQSVQLRKPSTARCR